MAKGNWKPEVIKPKTRCRLCGRVVKAKDFVRLGGINPAHLSCAVAKGREYTVGTQITPNTACSGLAELVATCEVNPKSELVALSGLALTANH